MLPLPLPLSKLPTADCGHRNDYNRLNNLTRLYNNWPNGCDSAAAQAVRGVRPSVMEQWPGHGTLAVVGRAICVPCPCARAACSGPSTRAACRWSLRCVHAQIARRPFKHTTSKLKRRAPCSHIPAPNCQQSHHHCASRHFLRRPRPRPGPGRICFCRRSTKPRDARAQEKSASGASACSTSTAWRCHMVGMRAGQAAGAPGNKDVSTCLLRPAEVCCSCMTDALR